MSNKTMGNRFESELCDLLSQHGFWAHNLAQNATGQPADIIAVKDNVAYLIDCKVCTNDRFRLARIEPNQESAMTQWKLCGNTECLFALKSSNGTIYMAKFDDLIVEESMHEKSIVIVYSFPTLKDWVEAI